MQRAAYSDSIGTFLFKEKDTILGVLTRHSDFAVEENQRRAWIYQIEHLQKILPALLPRYGNGVIYFEFNIPRMGRRIDALILLGGVLFVLEYKVGDKHFTSQGLDQVVDYALDLKNFHETSHHAVVAPILIASEVNHTLEFSIQQSKTDRVLLPLSVAPASLAHAMEEVLANFPNEVLIPEEWQGGRYQPTPTIIEAASALYAGHNVQEISRSDAGAINLAQTSERVENIIYHSRQNGTKSICFVTGVPGAGKTLVGLNIATRHIDQTSHLYSVFLSGNGPLVNILHEALARDRVEQDKLRGVRTTKGEAKRQVKTFIQNIHHFRDEGLKDHRAPAEHVVLFDEAQRAWNLEQTASFMNRKKGRPDFDMSEPAFLISCMDRHSDWAVIVCLVGGGQEINTGEAGISGWLEAIRDQYPEWRIYASPNLSSSEYQADAQLKHMATSGRVQFHEELHLSTSMRSFRAESVSAWVKAVLDGDIAGAKQLYNQFQERYPIILTRDFNIAKAWTRSQARGTERYGLVVSSQAQRLKPYAIDVKSPMDPVYWFLNEKSDVRSSYYLEDVATEFHVQGLELDWSCVAWDADFRHNGRGWSHHSFRGDQWQRIQKLERQRYQKNAYRVLLTRARQGMAIVVPEGNPNDPTRHPDYYNQTFDYLRELGVKTI